MFALNRYIHLTACYFFTKRFSRDRYYRFAMGINFNTKKKIGYVELVSNLSYAFKI